MEESDELTIEDRRRWAKCALEAYLMSKTGSVEPDQLTIYLEDVVGDLIADLLHVLNGSDDPDHSIGRAWRCGMRDFLAEISGGVLTDPNAQDPDMARVEAIDPKVARESLLVLWSQFYDPTHAGPPYDPDVDVNGGDLVDVVSQLFGRLDLVPEGTDNNDNA